MLLNGLSCLTRWCWHFSCCIINWTLQGPSQGLFVSFVHFQNAGKFCGETLQPKMFNPMSACERRCKFSTFIVLHHYCCCGQFQTYGAISQGNVRVYSSFHLPFFDDLLSARTADRSVVCWTLLVVRYSTFYWLRVIAPTSILYVLGDRQMVDDTAQPALTSSTDMLKFMEDALREVLRWYFLRSVCVMY